MKKTSLVTGLVPFAITKSFAKDMAELSEPFQLLVQYYQVKDAIVAGNAALAASNAKAFLKIANHIDHKVISEGNINALIKSATIICETKNIKKKRLQFVNLSGNMVTLAKATKLKGPVYEIYCPIKKANWLNSSKTIKNPYLGAAMLTSGKVVDTINK